MRCRDRNALAMRCSAHSLDRQPHLANYNGKNSSVGAQASPVLAYSDCRESPLRDQNCYWRPVTGSAAGAFLEGARGKPQMAKGVLQADMNDSGAALECGPRKSTK